MNEKITKYNFQTLLILNFSIVFDKTFFKSFGGIDE